MINSRRFVNWSVIWVILIVTYLFIQFKYHYFLDSNFPSHNEYIAKETEGEKTKLRFEITSTKPIFIRSSELVLPNLLYLLLVDKEESWGLDDNTGQRRNFNSYLQLIKKINYPPDQTSLGIMVSDIELYKSTKKTLESFIPNSGIHHATLLWRPDDLKVLFINRKDRKDPTVNKERRRFLARLRNLLMLQTIDREDAVLWLDSDIFEVEDGLVQKMALSGKEIITASCKIDCKCDESNDYDANAWKGTRAIPTPEELVNIHQGGFWEPHGCNQTKQMSQLQDGPDLVQLDSVGGTILYMKTDVIRQGVIFPPLYIIGTEFGMKEGWDGLETEGVCYIAQAIGYNCYGFPKSYVTHTRD